MTKHIFVSYSHADSEIADRLVNALARARIPFFIDRVALNPGASLTAALGQAIENTQAVVVIISRSSVGSEWVTRELRTFRELRIPIVPFKSDNATWPVQLRLILDDPLYVDGDDREYAEGLVPKILSRLWWTDSGMQEGHFFPLRPSDRSWPYAQFFFGTLETAWDELRFGRVAIVLPTDQYVNLGGRVTTSILQHLGISVHSLTSASTRITSREVSLLVQGGRDTPLLMAGTVFNPAGEPQAEDQWRSASAILNCAEQQRCTLVLVPPMGTGTFDWPVRQAVVNWLYGAIRWCRSSATVTTRSVWPVLCVPGPGDQKVLSYYLESLTAQRLAALEARKLTVRVRYQGEMSHEIQVSHDVLLGSIARSAFATLKQSRLRFRHGAGLIRRRSGLSFDYDADIPLAKTIFADGDIIEAYSPA